MGEHQQDGRDQSELGIQGNREEHDSHVVDRRVGDHALQVALGEGEHGSQTIDTIATTKRIGSIVVLRGQGMQEVQELRVD